MNIGNFQKKIIYVDTFMNSTLIFLIENLENNKSTGLNKHRIFPFYDVKYMPTAILDHKTFRDCSQGSNITTNAILLNPIFLLNSHYTFWTFYTFFQRD